MTPFPKLHEFAVVWRDRWESPDFQWSELRPSDITPKTMGLPYCPSHAERLHAEFSVSALDNCTFLDSTNDVLGLSALLYERWQDIWQRPPDSLPSEEEREWFRLVFRRLALLTGTNQYPFAGSLQTLWLVSCAGCFFSPPAPDKEVKQRLLISSDGSVVLQGFAYADVKRPCRHICFSVSENAVQRIFAAAVHYCNECFDPTNVILDAGGWNMELSSEEGGQYRFSGYLRGTSGSAEYDFSELLRSCLGRSDLFGIDGKPRSYSKLDRITLWYEETYSVPSAYSREGDVPECLEESACLVIDRSSGTVETTFTKSDGSRAVFRYERPDYVSDLLDGVSDPLFFQVNDTAAKDVVVGQNPTRTYELLLEREDGIQTTVSGRYGRFGLPERFPVFMEMAADCLGVFDNSLFSRNVFQQVPRRKTDLIYCSVEFIEGGSKTYYYRTEDDSLEEGDEVVVPAGKDNHPAIAEIVDVEYFSPDAVPFPIEKTKVILRRCTEEDYHELIN